MESSILTNGRFTDSAETGVASGWQATGPLIEAAIEPGGGPDGANCQRLHATGRNLVRFRQEASVAPDSEYVFRARVLCDDRVFVTVGQRRMGCTDLGRWQTIADVVRTTSERKLEVCFTLGGLKNAPNLLRICDVTLQRATRPSLPPRKPCGPVELVRAGRPAAWIVHPSADTGWQRLAGEVQDAVAQRTGVRLPLVDDREVTGTGPPVIRDPYRESHLILIGRLGLNRAIWPAYNRFLCAVDGWYPGGDGHVVRTASNVFRNGRSHVILGGSSDRGVENAVRRFIELLGATATDAGKDAALPWLLDVELGGPCRDAFQADDELWRESPFAPRFPPLEPGYGTVVRWYYNAMGWYWSGWPAYRDRAVECLDQVLRDKAHTHHYIGEFLVRVHDMLDDSGVFSAERTAGLDDLILENFWEFLTGPDLTRLEVFAPPFDDIPVSNRHNIAPWMADLAMAEYLQDCFEPTGELADILTYRRREKCAMLDHCTAERWNSSFPSIAGADNDEEVVASFFRYALEHERYDFFESGRARQALLLDKIDHRNARFTRPPGPYDFHPIMGILAHYYRDGRYTALMERLPPGMRADRIFQNRYINGVRRYSPGPEIPPEDPDSLAGVTVPAVQPHNRRRMQSVGVPDCRPPDFDPDEAMDRVCFRTGFGPTDDYVALTGTSGPCPAGAFLSFTSAGEYWFGAGPSAILAPPPQRYFEQNAAHVLRTDRWLDDPAPHAAAARLNWSADLGGAGGVSFTLSPFVDTAWQRDVILIAPGLYAVRDAVTALTDGEFHVCVTWQPEGVPNWDGRAWTSRKDPAALRISPLGRRFRVVENADGVRAGDEEAAWLRQSAATRLAKGERLVSCTVLQAARSTDAFHAAALASEDRLLLEPGAPAEVGLLLLWGPVDEHGLATDAAAVLMRGDQVRLLHARRLALAGQALFETRQPCSVSIDLGSGRVAAGTPGADAPAGTISGGDAKRLAEIAAAMIATARATAVDAEPARPRSGAPQRPDETHDAPAAAWSYDGLLRPGLIKGARLLAPDLLDLGSEARLAEVRAFVPRGRWTPRRVPDAIAVAPAGDDGGPPGPDSAAWRTIPLDPVWRPGLATGNYGRGVPQREAYQAAALGEVRAKYVRASDAEGLCFFDAAVAQAGTPLRVELLDARPGGEPALLLAPDVWPPFLRKRVHEDAALALVGLDGQEIWRHEPEFGIQEVRVLDPDGTGEQRIVVLTDDAQVRVFDARGALLQRLDIYAMHQSFHEREGRPNTRHPAGGYTMPYSLGLWRPGADGRSRMVVARYCSYTFLDADGRFEGVLHNIGYVVSRLLPHGVDFDGDGADEQLALGLEGLHHVHGTGVPHIDDPKGPHFYPQVYAEQAVPAPSKGCRVDGAPVLAFQPTALGPGRPRYVLVVRANYLGLYDALQRQWSFMWTPLAQITAADVVADSADRLTALIATADERLWQLTWREDPKRLADFESRAIRDTITRIRSCGGGVDGALLCGRRGLYRFEGLDRLTRLAQGPHQDALALPPDVAADASVVAVTARGRLTPI